MTLPRFLRPALAAGLTLTLAGAVLAGPLPVEPVEITKTTKDYEVEAEYPRTGLAAIDNAIAGWVDETVDDFVKTAEDDFASFAKDGGAPEWMRYGLNIDSETARNDDAMFVAVLSQSIATGGAHPNHYFATFNFLRPDGWRVYLPEIFDTKGLKRISDLAIADLTRQLAGPDGMSDTDWIKDGAGPSWGNFADFVLLSDALVLKFPPYQVAAYAAGDQEVEIPLSELAGLMRENWRAPAPSFDCGAARSAIEKAVCSDVALARLDRNVAGAYGLKLKYADDDAAREVIRGAQRAWLATRDAACAGGQTACLTGVYEARVAALKGSG